MKMKEIRKKFKKVDKTATLFGGLGCVMTVGGIVCGQPLLTTGGLGVIPMSVGLHMIEGKPKKMKKVI